MNALQSRRIVIATLFLPESPIFHEPLSPGNADPVVPTSDGMMSKGQTTPHNARAGTSGALSGLTPLAPLTGLGSAEGLLPSKDGLMVRPGFSRTNTNDPAAKATSLLDDLQQKSRGATPMQRPTATSMTPSNFSLGAARQQTSSRLSAVTDALQAGLATLTEGREVSSPPHDAPPVSFTPSSHANGGLRNAVSSVGDRLRRKLWIGTPNASYADYGCNATKRAEIEQGYRRQKNSVPVWVPDAEFSSMYDEYCHQVLWPSLHYAIPDAPKGKALYESDAFKEYQAVNQRFADVIVDEWKEGDLIWVNDYHLLLLPYLLRTHPGWQEKHQVNPLDVPIGFFLHVAFPSSEIFRCLSARAHLLRGILASDLVGFQTANNARHFRQTVSRILSWEALPKGIQVPDEDSEGILRGRFIDVGVFPMGIDVWGLRDKKANPDVAQWVQVLTQRYAGMKLIVGRDKLDGIQGVKQKIQAFEAFLDAHPEFHGKVVLIQVALQTTETNELAGGVAEPVAAINAKYSTLTYQPVVFLHTQDITFSQYVALLTVADAFMVTSLREGMALRTHEFVECQEGKHRPLILSEFTGSYSYSGFRSCIAINPWDKRGTANAINQALTMSDTEAQSRWEDLHNHVITQTAQAFITSFLTRVLRSHIEHIHVGGSEGTAEGPAPLELPKIRARWKYTRHRKIFLDLEGVLWQRDTTIPGLKRFEREVKDGTFEPPQDVIELVKRLAKDIKNEVWLMSGLKVNGVMDKFAEVLGSSVGVIAENGCFIKPVGEDGWISRVSSLNLNWKEACLEILNYFMERTPGSFVEEREASVVWRFWTSANPNWESTDKEGESAADQSTSSLPDHVGPGHPDRQWARRQAAEAQNHIFDSLGERYALRIVPGTNSFLVIPNFISRSSVIGAILTPGSSLRVLPKSPRSSMLPPSSSSGTHLAGFSHISENEELFHSEPNSELVLCITKEERLLRRLNDLGESGGLGDAIITVSTRVQKAEPGKPLKGRGTDAKWCLDVANAGELVQGLLEVR